MVDYDQSFGKWKDHKHIGSWYMVHAYLNISQSKI